MTQASPTPFVAERRAQPGYREFIQQRSIDYQDHFRVEETSTTSDLRQLMSASS
jgi:hypothetical protein